ncbi:MAG: hypothetical protein JWP12_913 [Bacteroidetes bacterium]|nr:hypothetical protein [Bacteroidota bacterium]
MRKLFLLLFVSCSYNSVACLNIFYAYDKEGNPTKMEELPVFHKNFDKESYVDKIKQLEARLKKDHNYMLLSDYSVCLMKLGKPAEALQLLIEIYKHYPNDYKIAANLGTAYELNDQPDSALKYIRRDIGLNPKDHDGSEWIHVKILEAEVQLKKDPAYLTTHNVLQLTEKQKKDSMVCVQLNIQLYERVPFTPGPNALMASLFTDFGDLSANTISVEYARAYYLTAKEYYGDKSTALDEKIKAMVALINKYNSKKLPPPDPHEEYGTMNPLGYVGYKQLLVNYDPYKYQVNWSKINTGVPALLKLVDFTKSATEVKTIAVHSAQPTDSLKLIPEVTDTATSARPVENIVKSSNTNAAAPTANNTFIYILIAGIVFVTGIFFGWRKLKKNN